MGASGAGADGGGPKPEAGGPGQEEQDAWRKELEDLGNHIRFFKNGKDQGPAYQQLIGGAWRGVALPCNVLRLPIDRETDKQTDRQTNKQTDRHVAYPPTHPHTHPTQPMPDRTTTDPFSFTHATAKYYPAVSLYMGGKVRANFGPSWICDPGTTQGSSCRIDFRPISALKEPLKKEELAAYLAFIEGRRAAWRARRAGGEGKGEGVVVEQREGRATPK